MDWLEAIRLSIRFMEEHLTDELTVEDVADSGLYTRKKLNNKQIIGDAEFLENPKYGIPEYVLRGFYFSVFFGISVLFNISFICSVFD